jgi:hypothetical protein
MRCTATRKFNLLGKVYKPGDTLDVPEFQAENLKRQALVTINENQPAAESVSKGKKS